jgi:hypothetical protein
MMRGFLTVQDKFGLESIQRLRWYLTGYISNFHYQGGKPDIFIFGMPRSGSTYLMEIIASGPRMKFYNEPLTANQPACRQELGVASWHEFNLLANREERYLRYFGRLQQNRIKELNVPFYRSHRRLLTDRIVFKIIHGAEGMVPWFSETFNGAIVLLYRHPVATTLSRGSFPRLPDFLQNPAIRRLFSSAELSYAEELIERGSLFEKGVLDWVIQLVGMTRPSVDPKWIRICYEDLAIYPKESFEYLREKLDLPPVKDITGLSSKPSRSIFLSDSKTKEFFKENRSDQERRYLVEKWRERASPEDVKRCFEICARFKLNMYDESSSFPRPEYRIPSLRQ